jgi:hypothetical protein
MSKKILVDSSFGSWGTPNSTVSAVAIGVGCCIKDWKAVYNVVLKERYLESLEFPGSKGHEVRLCMLITQA